MFKMHTLRRHGTDMIPNRRLRRSSSNDASGKGSSFPLMQLNRMQCMNGRRGGIGLALLTRRSASACP